MPEQQDLDADKTSSPAAQPGSVITPTAAPRSAEVIADSLALPPVSPAETASDSAPQASPEPQPTAKATPVDVPETEVANEETPPEAQTPSPASEADTSFFRSDAEDTAAPAIVQPETDAIQWTASEFVAHHKSPAWFVALAVSACAAAALVWYLTHDYVSPGVILIGALIFGVYGAREPRALAYSLDLQGLTIGNRYHPIEEFHSFSILPEGAFSSIVLMPLKRFAPLTTLYYAPEDEAAIVSILAATLPLEERDHDLVDRFMNRIHF